MIATRSILTLISYFAFIFFIFFRPHPQEPAIPMALKTTIYRGATPYSLSLNPDLLRLAQSLPGKSPVSLIADVPYTTGSKIEELQYTVQNYIAPRLLNPLPEEKIALVFCSSDSIAEQRLRETNYDFVVRTGGGKGIARKK